MKKDIPLPTNKNLEKITFIYLHLLYKLDLHYKFEFINILL